LSSRPSPVRLVERGVRRIIENPQADPELD
jgi:hypothetical protein